MSVETKPACSIPEDYIETWEGKSSKQTIEEVASLVTETHRRIDTYSFLSSPQGKLISPTAKCNITDIVARNTRVGELEYQALEAIERWVKDNKEGTIAWISPPASGVYPTAKIIISELEEQNGAKVLFNRAIVLDIDHEGCFKFAQDLAKFSSNRPLLSSLDAIRSNPLILKTHGNDWTRVLEELIPGLNLESVRTGEDIKSKAETVLQAQKIYQEILEKAGWVNMATMAQEISISGMMGAYDSSCPVVFGKQSAFGLFLKNSLLVGKSESCNKIKCGKCSWEANDDEVKKIQNREITCCPECGWKPGK